MLAAIAADPAARSERPPDAYHSRREQANVPLDINAKADDRVDQTAGTDLRDELDLRTQSSPFVG